MLLLCSKVRTLWHIDLPKRKADELKNFSQFQCLRIFHILNSFNEDIRVTAGNIMHSFPSTLRPPHRHTTTKTKHVFWILDQFKVWQLLDVFFVFTFFWFIPWKVVKVWLLRKIEGKLSYTETLFVNSIQKNTFVRKLSKRCFECNVDLFWDTNSPQSSHKLRLKLCLRFTLECLSKNSISSQIYLEFLTCPKYYMQGNSKTKKRYFRTHQK